MTTTMDADRLARIAQDLAVRVRDDDPAANGRWLELATTGEERWALLFVLAAAVPTDRPWPALVEWFTGPAEPLEVRRAKWRDAQRKRRAA